MLRDSDFPNTLCPRFSSIQYVTLTMPEINYNVNEESQCLSQPEMHTSLKAPIYRGLLLHWLSSTCHSLYKPTMMLTGHVILMTEDKRSMLGLCIKLGLISFDGLRNRP